MDIMDFFFLFICKFGNWKTRFLSLLGFLPPPIKTSPGFLWVVHHASPLVTNNCIVPKLDGDKKCIYPRIYWARIVQRLRL